MLLSAAFLLAALAAAAASAASATAAAVVTPSAGPCPCADPALCRPVQTVHQREVFGFSVIQAAQYDRYDWSQLTTVAWNEDPALLCAAHAAGARVVLGGRFQPSTVLHSAEHRTAWVAAQLGKALRLHLDGINFDLEEPIPPGDPLAQNYTALVAEAAATFHAAIPGSQVSVDVPWSPHGIDDRSYDWAGLAAAADLLFIMAYDMQSQIWGRCVASANSPAALVRRGVQQWLDLGAPATKLVLGLPWYSYRYPCINPAFDAGQEEVCALAPTPFRGAPCSDAAGSQLCYADIAAALRRGRNSSSSDNSGGSSGGTGMSHSSSSGTDSGRAAGSEQLVCAQPQFDAAQQSPYTACCWASDPPGSRRFQVWYDSPASLESKYALAAQLGLRGVGIWHLDCLDYRCTDAACRRETAAMWRALRAFTRPATAASGAGVQQAAAADRQRALGGTAVA